MAKKTNAELLKLLTGFSELLGEIKSNAIPHDDGEYATIHISLIDAASDAIAQAGLEK